MDQYIRQRNNSNTQAERCCVGLTQWHSHNKGDNVGEYVLNRRNCVGRHGRDMDVESMMESMMSIKGRISMKQAMGSVETDGMNEENRRHTSDLVANADSFVRPTEILHCDDVDRSPKHEMIS